MTEPLREGQCRVTHGHECYHRTAVMARAHAWLLRLRGWTPRITDLTHDGDWCMVEATKVVTYD